MTMERVGGRRLRRPERAMEASWVPQICMKARGRSASSWMAREISVAMGMDFSKAYLAGKKISIPPDPVTPAEPWER
jgi:hypothetical protein